MKEPVRLWESKGHNPKVGKDEGKRLMRLEQSCEAEGLEAAATQSL